MQLNQILKVTLHLIQLRTLGDIVTTTVCCLNRDIYFIKNMKFLKHEIAIYLNFCHFSIHHLIHFSRTVCTLTGWFRSLLCESSPLTCSQFSLYLFHTMEYIIDGLTNCLPLPPPTFHSCQWRLLWVISFENWLINHCMVTTSQLLTE